MGMRRYSQAADAQSKETTYSGLPKICKVINTANQGPITANVRATLTFDKVMFNYGGFAFTLAGANTRGIVVPEPGVYEVISSVTVTAGGGVGLVQDLSVNGGFPAGFPRLGLADIGAALGGQAAGHAELNAGDIVTQTVLSPTAYTLLANYCWLILKKEGGQY